MYLSSFRLGNCPERLVSLAGNDTLVAVIANAMDGASKGVREEAVQLELLALRGLGLAAEELDLRDHFVDSSGLAAELRRYEVVWLRGGNAFILRYALARTGADAALSRLLQDDAVVYSGYSAGPCVLAPSLRGLETVDSPHAVAEVYGDQPIWDGLGLLDYAIVPHVDSPDHPESQGLELVAARYRATGVPHRTLRDGEVLLIDGDRSSIYR
jgi:dipeptidase E